VTTATRRLMAMWLPATRVAMVRRLDFSRI
jgi:hypothetical protein